MAVRVMSNFPSLCSCKRLSMRAKPRLYCRYIDDIFITIRNADDARKLIDALKQNSVLNFTSENSQHKSLPFLDVLVKQENGCFKTSVFTKATNTGRCLNARGECPETYKKSVVNAYVKRAFTHCTSWKDVHSELDRIRQLLTNNGYQDNMIETAINRKMDQFCQDAAATPKTEDELIVYHRLNYGSAFKDECHAIKGIINRGVTPKAPYKRISLRIYSKPNLVASLIMRNSTAPRGSKETCTNVVYKFSCSQEMCKSPSKSYIGYTKTTLRKRLLAHRNNGAIHQHFVDVHDKKPSLQELIDNTEIIHRESNYGRILITEAVSIVLQKPTLNIQQEADQILPSSRGRRGIRRIPDQGPRPPAPTETRPVETRSLDETNVTELIRSLRPRPSRVTRP